MPVPQQVSIVSLGARDLPLLRNFYLGWGWSESEESMDSWCSFDLGGWLLALYPLDLLGEEAAPGAPIPDVEWRGFTLAINVDSESGLRALYSDAVAAGATVVTELVSREWGGISGYVADPEGNRWELAVGSEFVDQV